MRYYWMNMSCRKRDRWRLVYPPREVQRSRLGLGIDPSLLQPTTWLTKHVFFVFTKCFLPLLPLSPGSPLMESGKQEAAFDWLHCCRTRSEPLKTFSPEHQPYVIGILHHQHICAHQIDCQNCFLSANPIFSLIFSLIFSWNFPWYFPNIFSILSQYIANIFPRFCNQADIVQAAHLCKLFRSQASLLPARFVEIPWFFYIHIFLIAALFVEIPAVCHKF